MGTINILARKNIQERFQILVMIGFGNIRFPKMILSNVPTTLKGNNTKNNEQMESPEKNTILQSEN